MKESGKKNPFFDNRIYRVTVIGILFGVSFFVANIPWIILIVLAPAYYFRFIAPAKEKKSVIQSTNMRKRQRFG